MRIGYKERLMEPLGALKLIERAVDFTPIKKRTGMGDMPAGFVPLQAGLLPHQRQ